MKIFFFIVLLCILAPFLNIFCFCQVHTISVLYCANLCMKCSLGISNFLEEISSLSHSIIFLYFFALITEEGFLISPCYSLELFIQMGLSFLFSFAFRFFSFQILPATPSTPSTSNWKQPRRPSLSGSWPPPGKHSRPPPPEPPAPRLRPSA